MRKRWQLILPYHRLDALWRCDVETLEGRRYEKAHGQYFWWASIRLDTHQVDQGPVTIPRQFADSFCVNSRFLPVLVKPPF